MPVTFAMLYIGHYQYYLTIVSTQSCTSHSVPVESVRFLTEALSIYGNGMVVLAFLKFKV